MDVKVAIGQDSHRFVAEGAWDAEDAGDARESRDAGNARDAGDAVDAGDARETRNAGNTRDAGNMAKTARKPLLLGGVEFSGAPPLEGNSDADVVLHALCNAVSGVTGVNIIGETADRMLRENGVTDSAEYLKEALRHLNGAVISHISFSIECSRPIISPKMDAIRENIARLTGIPKSGVGITATSGEGLTDFGRGLGIGVTCVITVIANSR